MKKMKIRFQSKSKLDSRYKYFNDDNLIDVSQKQFLKQQDQLLELQNHMRSFVRGITDITNTIDNLYSCFKGIYEPNWIGNVEFNHMCQESIKIWRQFIADFKCNISKAIDDYGDQFPDMKRSIDKRNKKLSELSKQRTVYESYRNAKKIDEVKLKKAELEMKTTEQEYTVQNNSLKDSLPNFCDKRIVVYVDLWSKLFEAEEAMFTFLKEGRKNQLGVLSKLAAMADSDKYSIRSQVTVVNGNDTNLLSTKAYAQSAMTLVHSEPRPAAILPFEHGSLTDINLPQKPLSTVTPVIAEDLGLNRTKSYQVTSRVPSEISDTSNTGFFALPSDKVSIKKRISFTNISDVTKVPMDNLRISNHNNISQHTVVPDNLNSDASDIDEVDGDEYHYSVIRDNDIPMSANKRASIVSKKDEDIRKSLIYYTMHETISYHQVVATFEYNGQDEDELSLRKDDIILVLPWDDDEQMEDGWLFGENVLTKKKGLFPENHTTRLDS